MGGALNDWRHLSHGFRHFFFVCLFYYLALRAPGRGGLFWNRELFPAFVVDVGMPFPSSEVGWESWGKVPLEVLRKSTAPSGVRFCLSPIPRGACQKETLAGLCFSDLKGKNAVKTQPPPRSGFGNQNHSHREGGSSGRSGMEIPPGPVV